MWNETEFAAWRLSTGLSAEQISGLLSVSDRTVQRMTDGSAIVSDKVTLAARKFTRVSRTTDGDDGDTMDSVAEQCGWADVCAKHRHLYVTGMSAAIARGWTSAKMGRRFFVSQPPRMVRPEVEGKTKLVWLPHSDMLYSVECRDDSAGRPYRIACAELTLLDVLDNEGDHTVDELLEAMNGARHLAKQRVDVVHVKRLAALRGRSTEEGVNDWLREDHWSDDRPRWPAFTDNGYPASGGWKSDEWKWTEHNRLRSQYDDRLLPPQRRWDATPSKFDSQQYTVEYAAEYARLHSAGEI